MFGGLGKLADMGNMLKQAQLVQERMKSAQADIEAHEVEGVSGGGMVKVRMKGTHQLLKIEIADSAFGDDKEMCEDLIVAAVNDANRQLAEYSAKRMEQVTNGVLLPPGFKFPF